MRSLKTQVALSIIALFDLLWKKEAVVKKAGYVYF